MGSTLKISGIRHFLHIRNIIQVCETVWLIHCNTADLAFEFQRRNERTLPSHWRQALPKYTFGEDTEVNPNNFLRFVQKITGLKMLFRSYLEVTINNISAVMPELIGGAADVALCTRTYMRVSKPFQKVRRYTLSHIHNNLGVIWWP